MPGFEFEKYAVELTNVKLQEMTHLVLARSSKWWCRIVDDKIGPWRRSLVLQVQKKKGSRQVVQFENAIQPIYQLCSNSYF